ncbi:MAG TPA: MFS transporter [Ktedonobacteraceae bacterium]|nr:MFS transporter [Ktedonobacteraceae bacterium]
MGSKVDVDTPIEVTNVEDTAKNRLRLITIFLANTISMVGSELTLIALPWFVLQTTGSASKTGLTAFFETLPAVIAGIFGGAIIDRLGYRRACIIADVGSGISIALVPLLYSTVGLVFWQLLVFVFFSSLFAVASATSLTALLPEVAESANVSLEQANSTFWAIQRGAALIGAPLAGILIGMMSSSNVLWIDAATFFFSAVAILLVIPHLATGLNSEVTHRYLSEVKEGLLFIRQNRLILIIVLTIVLTNFLDAPLFAVIMPVFMKERFNSALDLGLAIAAFGGGGLVGAIVTFAWGVNLPRRAVFIGSFILAGLLLWALATLPSLPVTICVFGMVGLASGPLNPILMTIVQERVPATMRGRIFGSLAAVANFAVPLGVIIAGYLLDLIHLQSVLFVLAIFYSLVTFSLLFSPVLQEMDVKRTNENHDQRDDSSKDNAG